LFPSSAFQIPSSVKKVVNTSLAQFPWTYLLLVRNNTQTAEITVVKRITEKNITFNLTFRTLQHTSSEVTVHGSNNKIQTVNSEDVCWSIRKVKLKVSFFPAMGFFHVFFITVYAVCVLHVFFYQTQTTAKEQEYLLVVGSRKKRFEHHFRLF